VKAINYISSTRAIDNQLYFVFVNAAGYIKEGNSFEDLLGHTRICGPLIGEYKGTRHDDETIIAYTINHAFSKLNL
jgi:predicted amidohydrolase